MSGMAYYHGEPHVRWSQKGAQERAAAVGEMIARGATASDRPDIRVHPGASGTIFLAANKKDPFVEFEENVLPGVRAALDGSGIATDIYLEFGVTAIANNPRVLGNHVKVHHPEKPYHAVAVNAQFRYSLLNALHEIVHTIREERGWKHPSTWHDEFETDLMTVAIMAPDRMRELLANLAAYIPDEAGAYLPFDSPAEAIRFDRVLLTGSVDRALSVDEAYARVRDREVAGQTNLYKTVVFRGGRATYMLEAKRADEASARRSRRVVTVRLSSRPRSARLANGAGFRLFHALLGGREVVVHVTQHAGVTKAEVVAYLTRRLGATAVWECRNCKKVRVA